MNKILALFSGVPACIAYVFGVEYAAILPTLMILIGVDLITGIAAALNKKEKITSFGLRRTATKIMIYSGVLIGVYHMSTIATGDLKPIIDGAATVVPFYLGLVELKSIIENAAETGVNIPGLDKINNFLTQNK